MGEFFSQAVLGYHGIGLLIVAFSLAFNICVFNFEGLLGRLKSVYLRFLAIFLIDILISIVAFFLFYGLAYFLGGELWMIYLAHIFVCVTLWFLHIKIFHCADNLKGWAITTSFLAVIIIIANLAILCAQMVSFIAPNLVAFTFGTVYCLIFIYSFLVRRIHLRDQVVARTSSLSLIVVSLVSIAISGIMQFFVIMMLLKGDAEIISFSYLLICIILYLFIIYSYYSLYYMGMEGARYSRLQMELQMSQAVNIHSATLQNTVNEIRVMRHDFKNLMATLSNLAAMKSYDELEKMLEEVASLPLYSDNMVHSGHATIDAVINMGMTKIRSMGYMMITKLALPEELPFTSMDICSVLFNLIDNAIEANERFGIQDPINVEIQPRGRYLYIGVENQLPSGLDGKKLLAVKTTKTEDVGNHGYGKYIIQQIADKYCGVVSYDIRQDRFFAGVLLDLKFECQKDKGGN